MFKDQMVKFHSDLPYVSCGSHFWNGIYETILTKMLEARKVSEQEQVLYSVNIDSTTQLRWDALF
jgi:hypothetical protein